MHTTPPDARKIPYPQRIEFINGGTVTEVRIDGAPWGTIELAHARGAWTVRSDDGRARNRHPIPTSDLRDRVARMAYDDRKAAAKAEVRS